MATIPAPWAIDATGRAIPTHFTIVEGALVQEVEHVDAGAAYPVLADPSFSVGWTGLFVQWTRSEVKWLNGLGIASLGAAVGALCLGPHAPLCMAAVAGIAYVVWSLTDHAVDQLYNGGCRVETRLTPFTNTYIKC